MSTQSKIIAPLEERAGRVTVAHGSADLTYAAAVALDEGRRWDTDLVEGSVDVCRAIPHAARMAAWRGHLYSPGLAEAFAKFETWALSNGHADYSFRLSVYNAARQVARDAEWLLEAAKTTPHAPWPHGGQVSHPLTGETLEADDPRELAGMPFAFGAMRVTFQGIDPTSFADFVREGAGGMGAIDFLSHSLRRPEAWFTQLDLLDTAAEAWLGGGGWSEFAATIKEWNSLQDVNAMAADPTVIHLVPGISRKDEAVSWCSGHLRLSEDLLDIVAQPVGREQKFVAKDSS